MDSIWGLETVARSELRRTVEHCGRDVGQHELLGPEQRVVLVQQRSVPVTQRLHTALESNEPRGEHSSARRRERSTNPLCQLVPNAG
jgi:hypothetical protein